ncbi:MAG: pyridoxal-5-phosphate-dependent protein subunit beta [Defluviitaleaceae bacterium]|nr:pyridoxal-5-phosphate-dependent protein subunit beta [Defluviitaleaceae bacterium]MCL2837250.1 pyridoxal-5-phosphate-dependent protein subunit beta [Defluviitaleaceae bacterium]
MIDLTVHKDGLERNIRKARENGVVIPSFKQMKDPARHVPENVKEKLRGVGLWDVNPLNLFRITWKNERRESGGLYAGPNFIELPQKLTGVEARIICMIGKYFPTGCHKVGASFGCLAPRLVTGQFDSANQKAVWPSTGNYCRGGAFNSKLLACESVAILPEGMSRERFSWLRSIAGEIIATPGTESNVKEIFDKTNEIRATRGDCMIFNQFEEMGNYLWHYNITGNAVMEAFEGIKGENGNFAGICLTSGSAGSLAAGDFLKQRYPYSKIAVGEALQCPTILNNGFGAHRVEGIGDKHIPWVHNVRNTDMAIAVDDNDSMALLRLFNEPAGREYLIRELGMDAEDVNSLGLMGISGITNMLCSIKFAKYYELTGKDVVATILTDSVEMYQSRIEELRDEFGEYTAVGAAVDYAGSLRGAKTDSMIELTYNERKRVHNLKYYTWVEQQGREAKELDDQWYRQDMTFEAVQKQTEQVDALIDAFNESVGLMNG